ncbi:dimethylhistidine N-methyltransferase [Spirosomataceae bacterium TFI 002]|nr:dimethylhistidine N-methyltransferase [Spirosomataceae bacterium TFI 002]
MNNSFLKDTLQSLSQNPKVLNSKYFYDAAGDHIFQEIMEMEEYYLPKCELEIIKEKTNEIASQLGEGTIDVIELGAGDGSKTVHMLSNLLEMGKKVHYIPLDISANVLKINCDLVQSKLPSLDIEAIAGDYFDTMKALKLRKNPKLVLFLGSNIGNFKDERAIEFIKLIKSHMNSNDKLLIGADLKKNPKTILAAYNDKEGITKRFNLNLLSRMNRELGANFDITKFDHYPFYDPSTGICSSYIVSLEKQRVDIFDRTILFEKNECIHTEVSQKYSLQDLEDISKAAGFGSFTPYLDHKEWYCLGLMA